MQEQMEVSFGWRLPDGRRIKVTFNARIVTYEESKDRWLVVLGSPRQYSAAQPGWAADLPVEVQARIERLEGKWVYVPDAARDRITLPLKYDTLTGRIRYFYADDPRIA